MCNAQQCNSKPSGQVIHRDQLITIHDLENFKNDMLAAIRTLLFNYRQETAAVPAGKKWLKSYEVKRLLKISTGTLQHLRNSRQLPFSKLGGIMYYDTDAIQQMLSARDTPSAIPMAFQKNYSKNKKEKRA